MTLQQHQTPVLLSWLVLFLLAVFPDNARGFQAAREVLPSFPFTSSRLPKTGTTSKLGMVLKEPATSSKQVNKQELNPAFPPRPPASIPREDQVTSFASRVPDGTQEIVLSLAIQGGEEYDRLVEQMWRAEITIQQLQQNVTLLSRTLQEKQELLASQEIVQTEEQLKAQKQQLDKLMDQETQAQKDHSQRIDSLNTQKTTLEKQISELQDDLVQTQIQIRSELDTQNRLNQRMGEVEGTQEWERDEFEKDTAALSSIYNSQQAKLDESQGQLEQEESQWKEVNEQLRAELEQITTKAQAEQSKLDTMLEEQKLERDQLQNAIREQELLVAQTRTELAAVRATSNATVRPLQDQLQAASTQYESLQDKLWRQTLAFLNQRTDLGIQLNETQTECLQLSRQIDQAQRRQNREQELLNDRIKAEQQRGQLVKDALQKERLQNEPVIEEWQSKLQEQRQRQQGTATTMQGRYSRLRQLLTSRWQSAKLEGRQSQRALTQEFEESVEELQATKRMLQESVEASRQAHDKLQAKVKQETQEAKELWDWHLSMDNRMKANLEQAQLEIQYLQSDQSALREELQDKESNVHRMESSVRAIVKASWILTRQRLSNTRKRIFSTLRLRRRGRQQQQ